MEVFVFAIFPFLPFFLSVLLLSLLSSVFFFYCVFERAKVQKKLGIAALRLPILFNNV
jgi:hypothetical protein